MSQVAEREKTVSPRVAHYVAEFRRGPAQAPPQPRWLVQARESAIERFEHLGFPTTRLEQWRFTSVAPIAERTFQLAWHLAEGVTPGGSLWIQSFHPDHPALAAVAAGVAEPFYRKEWAERLELGYPPARRMGRVVVTGPGGGGLVDDLAAGSRTEGLTVLGPARAPGGGAQVIVLGGQDLPAVLSAVLAPLRGRRRLGRTQVSVDVDPVELT